MSRPRASLSDALTRSLRRVLDAESAPPRPPAAPPSAPVGPPTPPAGTEYSLDRHLGNKGALINELFQEVNSFGLGLGGDVTRRIRKQYIGYFRGRRSFFTAELQQQRIIISLSLSPAATRPWNDQVMRDATQIGHFGMGDVEYSLRSVEQLDEVKQLIQAAYDARG